MGNHWNGDGDLVIEEKTLFRQVGWQMHNNQKMVPMGAIPDTGQEGYSPMYVQIAVDHGNGNGWED